MVEELLSTLREEMVEIQRRQNWGRLAVNAPVEILCRIFQLACFPDPDAVLGIMAPGDHCDLVRTVRALRQERQSISSVCARWRDVALQDCVLWRNIPVEYVGRPGVLSYKQIMCEIGRSGTCELSLYLVADHTYGLMLASMSKDLKETVYRRVHTLSVSTPASKNHYPPIIAELDLFPNLQTLRIGLDMAGSTHVSHSNDLKLAGMAQLRELVIDCGGPDSHWMGKVSISPPRPCSITHLVLWSPLTDVTPVLDFVDCIRLINSCQYLERLDWSSGMRLSDFARFLPPFNLQSQDCLTELSIAGDFPISMLPQMHYPNLLKLRIFDHHKYDEDDQPDETILNVHDLFATTKFPKLRHLDQRLCAHPEHIIPFLHAHPELEELVLWHDIDEAWVDGLTSLSGSAPSTFQLPNLSRVWTNYCYACAHDEAPCGHRSAPHVDKLLRTRTLHQNPSRPFTLYLHPGYHGPDVMQLAEIHREDTGVRVRKGEYPNTTWYRYEYR